LKIDRIGADFAVQTGIGPTSSKIVTLFFDESVLCKGGCLCVANAGERRPLAIHFPRATWERITRLVERRLAGCPK
jgi:hypothetical protein